MKKFGELGIGGVVDIGILYVKIWGFSKYVDCWDSLPGLRVSQIPNHKQEKTNGIWENLHVIIPIWLNNNNKKNTISNRIQY